MKTLHPKVKELKLRSTPIVLSGSYVDENGTLQNLDFKVETSDKDRLIKGYLAVWGNKDTIGTIFVRGCFKKSIQERGPDSASKQKIAALWMHDQCNPYGKFQVLKEDDYGLYFESLADEVEIGDRALTQVRSGTLNQFSVGVKYLWDRMLYDDKLDAVLVQECELWEGSVVTWASNDQTYALRGTNADIAKEMLIDETELFISSLPRDKQLEVRQLITRRIALERTMPDEPLRKLSPPQTVKVGDYNLNLKEFTK